MAPQCGTATMTAVRAEQMDTDPQPLEERAVPIHVGQTGTMTRTAIATEQARDDDFLQSPQSLIPSHPRYLHLGTATSTNVRAEEGDEDPQPRERVFPANQTYLVTKTQTFVAQERSDSDPGEISRKRIPVSQHAVRCLGTQTMTKVLAESPDQDPGRALQAIFGGHQSSENACTMAFFQSDSHDKAVRLDLV